MAGGGQTEKVLPRITYTIGHEMGIMFGFIGLMLIATVGFAIFWVGKNKRQARLERERQEVLRQAGWGLDGWKRNEKGDFKTGDDGVREDRVETVGDRGPQTKEQIRMEQAMREGGQAAAFRQLP